MGPKILTYRYPSGFKTGIDKYRLVSISAVWYRFALYMRRLVQAIMLCIKNHTSMEAEAMLRPKGLAFLSIA